MLSRSPRPQRAAVLAVVFASVAYAIPFTGLGWNQGAHYALVRALGRGTAHVDAYRGQTGDLAYFRGHYYAAKAPGLAFASMPAYGLLSVTGIRDRVNARAGKPWRAAQDMIWLLQLSTVVLPAAVLLLLVASVARRIDPDWALASALTLGLGTLLLPFATAYFAHVLSALLGFAAFALLWRRDAPRPFALVFLAGLAAGFAVTVEYSLAIVAGVLAVYVLVPAGDRVRRAVAYLGGSLVGVAPVLAYNVWAFGSISHLSYAHAVVRRGVSGHDVVGANASGFFGVGVPNARHAVELLVGARGLLALSPVVALGVVGALLLYRRGQRAEAAVILAVGAGFLLFDAGYYLPFAGQAVGPRLLVPVLPFLAVPLALMYRRYPATTLALAVASGILLVTATATVPLSVGNDIARVAHAVVHGEFRDTAFTFAGVGAGAVAVLPFLCAVAAAVVCGVVASTGAAPAFADLKLALACLAVWAALATLLPQIGSSTGLGAAALVLVAAALAAVVVAAAALHRATRGTAPAKLGGASR